MINIDFKFLLYLVSGVVAAYLCLLIVVGFVRGWEAVKKIWFWTKKIWWVLLAIVGLYFVSRSLRKSGEKKRNIEQKIEEVEALENKTEDDKREIARLESEKKKVEQEIVDISKKYSDKVEELKKKPDQPKPGDAGRSSDNMSDTWR